MLLSKLKTVTIRPKAPWFTEHVHEAKRRRHRAERRMIKSGLCIDRELYRRECDLTTNVSTTLCQRLSQESYCRCRHQTTVQHCKVTLITKSIINSSGSLILTVNLPTGLLGFSVRRYPMLYLLSLAQFRCQQSDLALFHLIMNFPNSVLYLIRKSRSSSNHYHLNTVNWIQFLRGSWRTPLTNSSLSSPSCLISPSPPAMSRNNLKRPYSSLFSRSRTLIRMDWTTTCPLQIYLSVLDWIRSYLHNRSQRVIINDTPLQHFHWSAAFLKVPLSARFSFFSTPAHCQRSLILTMRCTLTTLRFI